MLSTGIRQLKVPVFIEPANNVPLKKEALRAPPLTTKPKTYYYELESEK